MSHTRSRKHHPARITALVAATFSIAASVPNTNAADEAIELEEVSVKSKKVAPKDGYQATKTRVGKTLQDPHDIPQAVTTVTNQLMHDQQVGS